MKTREAPRLKDVAARAGVSTMAASAVLNGARTSARVSEPTRRRIVEAAAELHYRPHAVAQGLARRRTGMIAVVFSRPSTRIVNDPYPARLLQGILEGAAETGYAVAIYPEAWLDTKRLIDRLGGQSADGVVLIAPPRGCPVVEEVDRLGLPAVIAASTAAEDRFPCVDVDNLRGARLAVEHLLSLGHRRIAHLSGNAVQQSAVERRRSFEATLHAAGISPPPEYLIPGCYSGQGVHEQFRALLELPEPPTALFTGNDRIALALLEAARRENVSIPGDFSLVGFDDSPPAALVDPPLTTIYQPIEEIGAAAVCLLARALEGSSSSPGAHLLDPELRARGSTAPPAPSFPHPPAFARTPSQQRKSS